MKIMTLALITSAFTSSAMAADLPSRLPPPQPYTPPPPVFTWTGYYIGATAGYAFDGDHNFNNFGAAGTPGFVRNRSSGFTGGGEIGYNYQFANTSYFGGTGGIVVGVEADAAYVGPGSDTVVPGATTSVFHSRTEFVGTARGRLGYGFNNFLVYGTGGFAYGGVDDRLTVAGANVFNGYRSSLRTGYAYGGGVAYALPTTSFINFFRSSAVTVKAEFIRYDLGTGNMPLTGAGAPFTSQIKTQGNLVRAGIDYKIDFSASPAPILAKY